MTGKSVHKSIIENARILIVDDQLANVMLMERLLQAGGYRHVSSITESREVIDQFRVFKPDLILLDLSMPKVDGYGVMAQLKGWISEETYLPILVITADVSRTAKQKALSLGARDFLTKPVDATEVLLRIYNLLQTQWLYRQIQEQHSSLLEQVRISKSQLLIAQAEMERLAGKEGMSADLMMVFRTEMARVADSMDRLAQTAEGPLPTHGPELPEPEAEITASLR